MTQHSVSLQQQDLPSVGQSAVLVKPGCGWGLQSLRNSSKRLGAVLCSHGEPAQPAEPFWLKFPRLSNNAAILAYFSPQSGLLFCRVT